MSIFVIIMNNNFFGAYSSVKRARSALENFLANDENVTSVEDLGNYCYSFTTKGGEKFNAEIMWDVLDAEFEEGIVKEDN